MDEVQSVVDMQRTTCIYSMSDDQVDVHEPEG